MAHRSGRNTSIALAIIVGIVWLAIIAGIAAGSSGSSKSSAPTTASSPPPPPPPPAPPTGKPKFVLVVRDSACGQDPALAYINCHVAVRNVGTAAGDDPTVYVGLRYSDNGQSESDNENEPLEDSDKPGGFQIAPHSERVIYLRHGYNATQHDLIQAYASLDLNAKRWPYITVTN